MTIQESIQRLAGNDPAFCKICKVAAINTDHTIDCEPLDNTATIYNVRLLSTSGANGMLLKPKTGSFVIVGLMSKNIAAAINFAELTDIEINTDDTFSITTKTIENNADDIVETAKNISQNAQSIILANSKITEPGVLGTKLSTLLTNIIAQLTAVVAAISVFASAQSAVTKAIPALAPLTPAYDALIAACSTLTASIGALTSTVETIKSKTVKLD